MIGINRLVSMMWVEVRRAQESDGYDFRQSRQVRVGVGELPAIRSREGRIVQSGKQVGRRVGGRSMQRWEVLDWG